jgi:murein DD-endopeptidase MepM/ murein hydrolase activator NlpD
VLGEPDTGNSTQPHLHFQLADSPDVLTSNSLPFVIDRYTLAGSVALDRSTDTNLVVEGTPEDQEKTHPLFPSVADFR